jgi:hypothetical protein
MRRDFSMGLDQAGHVSFSGQDVTPTCKRQQFTKSDLRAAMAELREQREARTPQHSDPEWVARYWKQVSKS